MRVWARVERLWRPGRLELATPRGPHHSIESCCSQLLEDHNATRVAAWQHAAHGLIALIVLLPLRIVWCSV